VEAQVVSDIDSCTWRLGKEFVVVWTHGHRASYIIGASVSDYYWPDWEPPLTVSHSAWLRASPFIDRGYVAGSQPSWTACTALFSSNQPYISQLQYIGPEFEIWELFRIVYWCQRLEFCEHIMLSKVSVLSSHVTSSLNRKGTMFKFNLSFLIIMCFWNSCASFFTLVLAANNSNLIISLVIKSLWYS
jgi:hypothetical protein